MSRVRQGLRKAENQTDMGGQSERGQAWEPQVLRTQVAVSAGEGRPWNPGLDLHRDYVALEGVSGLCVPQPIF